MSLLEQYPVSDSLPRHAQPGRYSLGHLHHQYSHYAQHCQSEKLRNHHRTFAVVPQIFHIQDRSLLPPRRKPCAELNDIAVLHDVVFAFHADLTGSLRGGHGTGLDQVVV